MDRKRFIKGLSVAAAALKASSTFALGVTALPAHAAPTYQTTDDIGRRTAPTARPDGNYGVPRGFSFAPDCQQEGEPHGTYGNKLYFRIYSPRHGMNIFIPDAWTNSPHQANQGPIAGIPICNASTQQDNSPNPRSGAGNFANGSIADFLLQRVGQNWGQTNGQCRQAVNIAVSNVSGGRTQTGGYRNDYNQGFRAAGAYQVPTWQQALKGDIVQVGTNENDRNLHTYVIVSNYGNGNFRVVDSNSRYDTTIRTYDRSFNHNGTAYKSTIWRVGKV